MGFQTIGGRGTALGDGTEGEDTELRLDGSVGDAPDGASGWLADVEQAASTREVATTVFRSVSRLMRE
jgi:hypothetical protein